MMGRIGWGAVLLFFLSWGGLARGNDVMTLGASNQGVLYDASIPILTKAYAELGIVLKVQRMRAEMALVMSNSGHLDGEIHRIAGIESKYTNLIKVPVAINYFEAVAIAQSDKFHIQGWQSLKPYRVGVQNGLKYAERGTLGMYVSRANNFERLFDKLHQGKLEMVIWTRLSAMDYLQRHENKQDHILEPAIARYDLYHYLNREHTALVPKITQLLQQMKERGEIQSIRDEAMAKFELKDTMDKK